MKNDFLGFPFWNIIRNLNIGLFAFLIFCSLFPNQDPSTEDILLAFFFINAPLWLYFPFALYIKLKDGINGIKKFPPEDLDQADILYEEAKEDYQAGQYKLAIEKLDKAIEINDVEAMYFYERGHAKDELEDYKGAEEDFTEAIRSAMWEEQDLIGLSYYARAYVRLDLENKKGACEDWTKAVEMGVENAAEALEEHCKK